MMDFLKTENMLFVLTLLPTSSPSPRPHIMLAHTNSTYYNGGSKKQIDPNEVCFIKKPILYIFSKEGRTNSSSVCSIGFYRQRKIHLIVHVLRYINYDFLLIVYYLLTAPVENLAKKRRVLWMILLFPPGQCSHFIQNHLE